MFEGEIWQKMFWNNTVQDYVITLAILLGLIVIFGVFQKILLNRLRKLAEKTKTKIDDAIIEIFSSVKPPFYVFLAFYVSIQSLTLPDIANKIVSAILIIWVIVLVIKAVQIFINSVFKEKMDGETDRGTKSALGAINIIVKVVIWSVGLMLILSNLGVDITSLIAGLGIGGVAIAFALQNILSDLFSSFAIYFDKPFVVGDFIIVGDKMGTVERIGIKTTRIRALQGEELVISNNELTSAQIQNFKKMQDRRIVQTVGVLYETSYENLKRIPVVIRDIMEHLDNVELDRVNFSEFDSSSLNFEIVYYVKSPDYNTYMNLREELNYRILEEFKKLNVEMAYPTQTLYVKK